MATRSSIFAWKVPWGEEPGSYRSWGFKKSDTTECANTHTYKALFKAGVPASLARWGNKGSERVINAFSKLGLQIQLENSRRILKRPRFYPEISPRTGHGWSSPSCEHYSSSAHCHLESGTMTVLGGAGVRGHSAETPQLAAVSRGEATARGEGWAPGAQALQTLGLLYPSWSGRGLHPPRVPAD